NRYSGLFGKVCAEINRMLKARKSKEEIEMTVRERFGEKEVGKLTGLQVDKVGAKVSKSLVNESFKDEGIGILGNDERENNSGKDADVELRKSVQSQIKKRDAGLRINKRMRIARLKREQDSGKLVVGLVNEANAIS